MIKVRQLTSQHMLDELLKIQVTPCQEINCSSSCIRVCNRSALEAKWSLFFISLNQNDSLSLQTDEPWKAEAWLYICEDVLLFIYECKEAFQQRSLVLHTMIKPICIRHKKKSHKIYS